MPIHSAGKDAYQWGKTGKVYKGKDAKKKAIKQAIAIAYSEAKRRGKKKPSQEEIEETIKGEEITKEESMLNKSASELRVLNALYKIADAISQEEANRINMPKRDYETYNRTRGGAANPVEFDANVRKRYAEGWAKRQAQPAVQPVAKPVVATTANRTLTARDGARATRGQITY